MRTRSTAFLVLAIAFLLISSAAVSSGVNPLVQTRLLAPSNGSSYSENLSIYLTSGETFWRADLIGGNISVSNVTVPQSVSSYSVTLTRYDQWKSQFELFGPYGFGLLGVVEPNPNGALLIVNTTSQTDAQSLANSLSQRFALAFQQTGSSPTGFSFYSPIDFTTELHVFFWKLVPTYYGGFAKLVSENHIETGDLSYFKVGYQSGTYSISLGQLVPLAGTTFTLYRQLGLSPINYNYSSFALNSTVQVRVLGGLISNANIPYVNDYSNYTAYMSTDSRQGNGTIPNLNATLNLSFPTILAYRQISPSLTPTQNSNVSVTIYVKNVSPIGTPNATNVSVNDTWIYAQLQNFRLTIPTTGQKQNLTSDQSFTVAYAFTVLASNGTFSIPATPVTYSFTSANKTITSQALLNPEILVVGGANTPELEATESLSSGAIQAGQTFSVNVTVANKGSGTALNIKAGSLSKENLPAGSTWSFVTNSSAGSLTQANTTVAFPVSWSDASGKTHQISTNTLSALFGFGSPSTPSVSISKVVTLNSTSSARVANVTLSLQDTSPNSVSNLSIVDPLPSGTAFVKSYNSSSIRFSNGAITGNMTSLAARENKTLTYSINFTSANQNIVFLPAAVSTLWNNITITHSSAGYGLPLGVVATKSINPSQGFQGSVVLVTVEITNNGSLPIYNVNLSKTYDTFMQIQNTSSSLRSILLQGQSISTQLQANLTGSPGEYSSSSAAASFIFAGANKTATSNVFKVVIYQVLQANLSYSGAKIEENHDININVVITNPSNVTVSNVTYILHLPQGLSIVQGKGNYTGQTLAPGQSVPYSFTVRTSQPNEYTVNAGILSFVHQGKSLKGVSNTLVINIGDDITTRYLIPVGVGILFALATILYVRRLQKKQ